MCSVAVCLELRPETTVGDQLMTRLEIFLANTFFVALVHFLHLFNYFCIHFADHERMYIVQGWRQEAEEVCLHALLENPEGQAQVVGKVEASWKCQKKNKQQETKSNGKFVSFIICTWNSTCTHPCCWWWWWTDGEPPGRPMLKRRSRSYDNIQPWKQWTILLSNG